jgi:four helix bundle protein
MAALSIWDLLVFQKAYAAALDVHRLTQGFPRSEQFELASQLRRSSKSICANLAEGRGRQRGSNAEFRRFLVIAIGSADETSLWIRFALDLGYIDVATCEEMSERYREIARMLNGLMDSLRKSPSDD